jgi:S-methylmethionine-dependent homocysteine/selenocysteine methylase
MGEVVLLDGGMGQELIHRSKYKPHPMWSAKVLLEEPDLVEDVHYDYILAGAKVITLNNYSCTPERLERDGSLDMFKKLQEKAIYVAKRARDRAKNSSEIKLAGCLPPLYASYKPENTPDFEESVLRYERIAEVQVDHVDILICETMSSIKELKAAGQVASKSDKPAWVSGSVSDQDGSFLRSGENLVDGVTELSKLSIDAVLLNCSFPESITTGLKILKALNLPFGAYPNRFKSIDKLDAGGTVDVLEAREDLDEDNYAKTACDWVDDGAVIVGGCCEIGPKYINALSNALQENGHKIVSELK